VRVVRENQKVQEADGYGRRGDDLQQRHEPYRKSILDYYGLGHRERRHAELRSQSHFTLSS
jgi:hypothetical protein